MPASEFAQKQVGVVAGLADVVQDGGAAHLAGVVDQQDRQNRAFAAEYWRKR